MGNRVAKNSIRVDYEEVSSFIKDKILKDASTVIKYDPSLRENVLKTCSISINQLDRLNDNLNKKDLVAIYAKLTNNNVRHEDLIKFLSKKDLNCLIRYEVYRDIIENKFDKKDLQ